MSRAVRLIRKHGFLPGNGLEALVEEALSANAPDQSERVSRLEEALTKIAAAEALYRITHDTKGDGHIETGRAWDRLRRAGDRARSALNQDSSNKLEERLRAKVERLGLNLRAYAHSRGAPRREDDEADALQAARDILRILEAL